MLFFQSNTSILSWYNWCFGVWCLSQIGKEIYWEGSGLDEVGKERDTGVVRVSINPKFYRPAEVVSVDDYYL